MKKNQLLLVLMVLPLTLSAHDIAVENADGVTIYYNYANNGAELAVTCRGSSYDSYSNEYSGNVVIPEEVTYMNRTRKVTSIGDGAFNGCYGLTSVTIPNSVTSIGDRAFSGGCSGLTSITIGNSVTSIGDYAFWGCSGLTSVTIGNSVTSIGDSAFYGCSGLTSVTIGNSVTSIGGHAFDGCSGLQKVIVKDIAAWCRISFGDYMSNPLYYAKHLYSDENTEITDLVIPNSVTSIGGYAFWGCSGLTSVTIGNSVTSIGGSAFYGCSSLTSVTIPNSVTSIGGGAFYLCSGLTSVTIGNSVTSIGDYAFEGCSRLTSVTIPNSVTSIGFYAFKGCSGLTSVTIGNSVTSIGAYAFYGCSKLTSVIIPNSVTSIGDGAFNGCSGLQKVIVKDIAAWCRISFGDNPFYYAKHLYSDENTEITDLVIPNSVTSIEASAFRYCSGLTSVTIGNSVTSIGNSAFYNCSGLTSITIGSGVTSIGAHAFDGADIPTIISLIENPSAITDKSSSMSTFSLNTFNNSTLYVPVGTIDKYKATEGWQDFEHIVEGIPAGINEVEKTNNNKTAIYDLNGVRLSEPKRGVNIVNGKKIVVN